MIPDDVEWEKIQRESKQKRNDKYLEDKRLDFIREKIHDLERMHGDMPIIGVEPLSNDETKEYILLLIDEQEGKKVNSRRLYELENRMPFNDVEIFRTIQSENGLSRNNFIDDERGIKPQR